MTLTQSGAATSGSAAPPRTSEISSGESVDPSAPTSATSKIFAYPRNAWYVAAWDYEVTARAPFARTVAGRPLALWRTSDGQVSALADACWHRLAPLSKGKVLGDELQCPYHGLRYNRAGRCTSMPAQQTVNPSAVVASFPVVERHRFIWVWLGDPDLADPDLVPDMHQINSPGWAGDGATIHAKANYQLLLDNLMDLTHEEFVHSSSIGQDELSTSEFSVTHDERHVTVSRWMRDVEAPPAWGNFLRDRFPGYRGRVDRWQIIQYEAPSTIRIDVGVAKAGTGAPEGDRSQGVSGCVMNTITPETDRSCHYFWSFMRDWCLDSQSITTTMRANGSRIFGEDEDMLIAQQDAIDANPDYEFYSLNIDAGGMWVRRILDRMLQAEGRSSDARIQD